MRIDRSSRLSAKKALRACRRADGSIDESGLREIVSLYAREKPRNYLAVLSHLARLVELALEESTVRIESATALPDRGASVAAALATQYGPAARTYYEENSALLGGLRIRRGNNIWDGSLSGRLNRLKQALS